MRARAPLLVAALLAIDVATVVAQDYPARPIRVLTATSAGGTSDIFMRVVGEEIQKRWGQPIVVENRPGGGMTIGGRACAEAPNDGYTICILPAETLAYNQYLFRKIPYDPARDFDAITNPFFNTQVLVAATALDVKTLDDLAGCANDDLIGWNETVNGERKHFAGFLEPFGMSADEANAIIMTARRAAGWIKDEEPAEA